MSEKVVDYDDVIRMLDFLGVKYIEVDSAVSAKETILLLKGEENCQVHSEYRQ